MWVKIRASEAERAEWHAKARSAGLTLSDLVRRSVGRVRPWTVAHAAVERERTRELARMVKSRVVCKSERKLLDASVRLPWRPPWVREA